MDRSSYILGYMEKLSEDISGFNEYPPTDSPEVREHALDRLSPTLRRRILKHIRKKRRETPSPPRAHATTVDNEVPYI